MKLPKNYFENLSRSKFREYLKLLPNMKKENTKAVTMLIFTFFALSILGVFAINPTLSTIIDLKKQLEDDTFVHQQLTIKMNNLSSLQLQYNELAGDLPVVYDAIPENAKVTYLLGQIETVAKNINVQLHFIRVTSVILGDSTQKKSQTNSSFEFSLEGTGSYDDMLTFAEALTNFNRIVTIDTLSVLKDPKDRSLLMNIEGRGYFNK